MDASASSRCLDGRASHDSEKRSCCKDIRTREERCYELKNGDCKGQRRSDIAGIGLGNRHVSNFTELWMIFINRVKNRGNRPDDVEEQQLVVRVEVLCVTCPSCSDESLVQ